MKKSPEIATNGSSPAHITIGEMLARLPWFAIDVSTQALRQTLRELRIEPVSTGLGRNGRGRTAYYDFTVLWVVATAYHAAYSPKTRLAEVAKTLADLEARETPHPRFSISEFYPSESVKDEFYPSGPAKEVRIPEQVRRAYMAFVCDERSGLDPRIVTAVAREHWADVGLADDRDLRLALRMYVAHSLVHLGVNHPAAEATANALFGPIEDEGGERQTTLSR